MTTEPSFPKVTPELLSAGPLEWEATWIALWESIDPAIRLAGGWQQPWMNNPLHDCNPIFTAWSPTQKRGIRVIQHEGSDLLYTTYPDWFGDPNDPEQAPEGGAIRELVIACVLSDNSLRNAHAGMTRWVRPVMAEPVTQSPGYSAIEESRQAMNWMIKLGVAMLMVPVAIILLGFVVELLEAPPWKLWATLGTMVWMGITFFLLICGIQRG